MKKALWPIALAAIIVLAACKTTGPIDPNANSAEAECEVGAQSRQINAALQSATEGGGDMNAFAAANAAQLETLARSAGEAANQQTPAREASCRAIALRANAALLRSPAHEAAAFAALAPQAEAGERACAAIVNADARARADCDLIAMWSQSHEGLGAARALQAIHASVAGANETSPVSDEVWDRVDAQQRVLQDNVNRWSEAQPPRTPGMVPIVASHRTRVVCNARAPLRDMRNLAGSGSEAWQRAYGRTYPAMMLDAANALGVPATPECQNGEGQSCNVSRIMEVERVCEQLSGH